MILSNKQVKKLRDNINGAICWEHMVRRRLLENPRDASVPTIMRWHNEDAQRVNDILGENTIVLYNLNFLSGAENAIKRSDEEPV